MLSVFEASPSGVGGFAKVITPLVLGQRNLAVTAAHTVMNTAAIKGCVREIIRGTLSKHAADANTIPIDTALRVFCNEGDKRLDFIASDPDRLSRGSEEVLAHVLAALIDHRHVASPQCGKGDLHYQNAARHVQQ